MYEVTSLMAKAEELNAIREEAFCRFVEDCEEARLGSGKYSSLVYCNWDGEIYEWDDPDSPCRSCFKNCMD